MTKTSMTRSFMTGHQWGTFANMLRTVESQGTSIQQGATRIRSLNWPVTHSTKNSDCNRGSKDGKGNITHPDKPRGGQKHSIPRPPEVGLSKMQLYWHWLVCEDANRSTFCWPHRWNAAWAMQGSWCHLGNNQPWGRQSVSTFWWVHMYAGIWVIPCLPARFKMCHATLERKREAVLPLLHK